MARSTAILLPVLVLALAAPDPLAPSARAEGPGARPRGGVFPEVEEVQEEEAKALLGALEEALKPKEREQEKVLAALKPMVTKRHKKLVPDLKKLLADKDEEVAVQAATALGSQGDKSVASLLARVVTTEQRERGILVRGNLKAACIESLGRLGVTAVFDPVQRLAEQMLLEKEVGYSYSGPILRACVRYFGLTKEKRAVSTLIAHVDEPAPDDPNSGTNPPAAYWKKRFEIWKEMKDDVVWALREITGEEFETARRWRNWLDDEGKKAGMK